MNTDLFAAVASLSHTLSHSRQVVFGDEHLPREDAHKILQLLLGPQHKRCNLQHTNSKIVVITLRVMYWQVAERCKSNNLNIATDYENIIESYNEQSRAF